MLKKTPVVAAVGRDADVGEGAGGGHHRHSSSRNGALVGVAGFAVAGGALDRDREGCVAGGPGLSDSTSGMRRSKPIALSVVDSNIAPQELGVMMPSLRRDDCPGLAAAGDRAQGRGSAAELTAMPKFGSHKRTHRNPGAPTVAVGSPSSRARRPTESHRRSRVRRTRGCAPFSTCSRTFSASAAVRDPSSTAASTFA